MELTLEKIRGSAAQKDLEKVWNSYYDYGWALLNIKDWQEFLKLI